MINEFDDRIESRAQREGGDSGEGGGGGWDPGRRREGKGEGSTAYNDSKKVGGGGERAEPTYQGRTAQGWTGSESRRVAGHVSKGVGKAMERSEEP